MGTTCFKYTAYVMGTCRLESNNRVERARIWVTSVAKNKCQLVRNRAGSR